MKITSMSKLRKEKARLVLQIEQEKGEIGLEVEKFKESLWPFKVLRRFRKTVDSISGNKLLVIAAQLAYSFLNSKKANKEENVGDKKEGGQPEEKENGVLDYLKGVAKKFLEMYIPKQEEKED
jgi:hypothetical protein